MMKYHDGGDENVLTHMSTQMRTPGKMEGMAVRPLFFMIVGGQFGPGGGRDANTIARERILLKESDRLRIPVRAARFHTTTLEFDENGNALEGQRSLSVATISTKDGVFYRDEDGSSNGGSSFGDDE